MTAFDMQTRHGEVCPLDTTLKILTGKWKSIIICRLMHGEQRFTELLHTLPGCTRRMLALQLQELMTDQIIKKTVDLSVTPLKTSYQLTELGMSLIPIVQAMDAWGTTYIAALQPKKSATSQLTDERI